MQVERHGSLLIVLLGILMVEAGSSRKGTSIKFGRLLVLSAADDSRKKIAQVPDRVRQLFPAQTTTNDARPSPSRKDELNPENSGVNPHKKEKEKKARLQAAPFACQKKENIKFCAAL